MKKILLLLVVIFLVGCTTSTTVEDDGPTTCPPDCSAGYASISTTVDAPIGEVFAQSNFGPKFTLTNEGEAGLAEGVVCVTGLDQQVFSGYSDCQCQDFYVTSDDARDANFLYTTVDFPEVFVDASESSTEFFSHITRYSYTTYGVFDACLETDARKDTCSSEGEKLSRSSSGPVEVTSVTELVQAVGDTVTVFLTIEAAAGLEDNEQLVPLQDVSDNTCVYITTEPVLVDATVTLLGQEYFCPQLSFGNNEDTSSVTCVIDGIPAEYLIGDSVEHVGWVALDYGFERIDSVEFDVISTAALS